VVDPLSVRPTPPSAGGRRRWCHAGESAASAPRPAAMPG